MDNYIFALFENKLIIYTNNQIKEIYSLEKNIYKNIYYINSQYICLYGEKKLAIYDLVDSEIILEENLSKENKFYIIKIMYLKDEECLNVCVGLNDRKDLFYIIKYMIANVKITKQLKFEKCFVVEKKNFEYIDWFSKYLILINNRKEFYIANELENQVTQKNTITKKEMDSKDIEL